MKPRKIYRASSVTTTASATAAKVQQAKLSFWSGVSSSSLCVYHYGRGAVQDMKVGATRFNGGIESLVWRVELVASGDSSAGETLYWI